MPATEPQVRVIDWRLSTREGARREQLRRWAELPLEQVMLAIEEMQEIADWLSQPAHSEPLDVILRSEGSYPRESR